MSGNRPTEPAPVCPSCGSPLGDSGICPPCLLRDALAQMPASRGRAPAALSVSDFGDYRILEQLGEGAMGVVYRARKLSLKKDVAIKFLKAGAAANRRQRTLFLREAELASQLDHPNIATVTEVGELEGRLYLVMRFIDGRPLSEHLARSGFCPTVRERVKLILAVARAVHHAHQRGVIHRDLKPGNILLGPDEQPFVGDFGLARWLEQDSTITYAEGFAIGTPAFMPPEQAQGRSADLTTMSDVWSLGVILYLLISGRLPFEATPLAALVHSILNDDPISPFAHGSKPARTASAHDNAAAELPPAVDAFRLSRMAREDIECICLRCLEKSPARRYPTAGAFAEDLERWLDGRPVEARRPSPVERLARWTRRHPAAAGIVIASSIAVAALAWTGWQREVNRRTQELQRLYHYVADRNLAGYGLADSNSVVFRRAMDAAALSRAGPEVRGIEAGLLQRLGDSAFAPVWFHAHEPLLALAVDRKTSNVVAAGTSHLHRLSAAGQVLQQWALPGAMESASLAVDPSTGSIYLGSDRGIERWVPGEAQPTQLVLGKATALTVASDGRLAAIVHGVTAGSGANLVVLGGSNAPALSFPPFEPGMPGSPVALGWSASGVLRQATIAGGISEWTDLQRPRELAAPGLRSPTGRFSHSADRYFRTSIYGLGHVFSVPGGHTLTTVTDLPGNDAALAFSFDDRYLAVATVDGSVRIREVPSADRSNTVERLLMPGHVEAITAIAFAPDPEVVYTASTDGTLRRLALHAPSRPPYVTIEHRLKTTAGAAPSFAVNQPLVALHEARFFGRNPSNDLTMICDVRTGEIRGRISGAVIGWGPKNQALACDRDGRLNLWDLTEPSHPRHLTAFRLNTNHHGKIESKLAEQDRWIVSVTDSSKLEAFEVASGITRHLHQARVFASGASLARISATPFPAVEAVATSPGSACAAVYLADRGTWLWDFRREELHALLDQVPADMRFSPDGSRLAVTDYHRRLRLFDGRTGAAAESLPGHLGTVSALAFTPDARQLVTGSDDYTLVVWNLATQREVFRSNLRTRTFWITVSPDARWLVTAHPPQSMNVSRTDVGPGHYRLWPLFGADEAVSNTLPMSAHADSVWNHVDALAQRFGGPTPP